MPSSISYNLVPLTTYRARWGNFNLKNAVTIVCELALNNPEFHVKAFAPTFGEQQVLRHLGTCASGDKAHWMPSRRPQSPADRAEFEDPGDNFELWDCCRLIREGALVNGLPIQYEKFFYDTGLRDPVQIVYTAELGSRGPFPRDELDAVNAWFDYICTDQFAQEHGPLDKFEYSTFRLLKRNVQFWCMEKAGWSPKTMLSFIGFDRSSPTLS
ncbi:uncharacterized protein PHACADRAFT_210682 [Phanerochaete carnosa HHB-10118-sp]|uniref:Uncharacterized protein n=1 Tax=Phanerochaete carnosa (strain HHB-10118-sp) TaxID=650164 RepID=K5W6Z2_PHACS|nr:uncharacterized protein PHACADRAFT_210682 [Phanerochaete carnosa HHB-10118-sp]EKM54915.1 hypothetical protein PHACADRAFT_210682 [Phanerochaete carnosa HHB-10118-sp]